MALAEAPRSPLPAAPPQRSRRALEEQKPIITLALRSVLADDETRGTPVILPGRGEAPRVGRRRQVGRAQAAHAAAVDALLDLIPKHVLLHLPLALGHLALEDRALLRLYIQLGTPAPRLPARSG